MAKEDIDGKTLVSLTESMVSSLCQTMRKQVMLLEIINNLLTPSAPRPINNFNNLEVMNDSQTMVQCDDLNNIQSLIRTMKPWPLRYQIPILPPSVNAALDAKDGCFLQFHRNSCRNQLLQCLYDDISKCTMYPSSTQYSDVLASIRSKYPYLSDFPSRNNSSPNQLAITTRKFNEQIQERTSPFEHLDIVAEHKRKFGQQSSGRKRKEDADIQSSTRKVRALPNILSVGEDETTVAKHHHDMKTI